MSRREELRAEMDGLPWQKREAINEAILGGRAVKDESLALLAAEWAAERQRHTVRLFGVLGPLWPTSASALR